MTGSRVPNPAGPASAWQPGVPTRHAPVGWRPPASPRGRRRADDGRLVAVDLARFVAIVGMMAAHVVVPAGSVWSGSPTDAARIADAFTPFVNGNASTLFAVIGGMSLVLATRGQLASGLRGAAMLSTATRALLVMVLGFVLSGFGAPVYVVLHYFGWSMLLAMPLLLAPVWVVGVVAVLLTLGGPWLLVAVRAARWGTEAGTLLSPHETDRMLWSPLAPVTDLTFTGEYPAVTWVASMAIGMLVVRALLRVGGGLRGRLLGLGMLLAGAALVTAALGVSSAVLGSHGPAWFAEHGIDRWSEGLVLLVGEGGPPGVEWWWQLTAIAHTGTLGDIARGVGASLVVLGLLTIALPAGSRAPAPLQPLRAAGAAPLTLYSLHVVALALAYAVWFVTPAGEWLIQGVGAWAVHVLGAIALGALLAVLGARGPLEAGVSALARLAGGLATPRPPGLARPSVR